MTWFRGLESIVEQRVPLADRTWYRIGGLARYFCLPRSAEDVQEIVRRCRAEGLALRVLGAGANVLIRDQGFDGVVLHLDRASFGSVRLKGNQLLAGAATPCPDLVRRTVDAGCGGLEVLAGIPGTVGGVVCMNAGGRYGDVSETVRAVRFVDDGGSLQRWSKDQLSFSYRRSNLKDVVILDAEFELRPAEPCALRRRYSEIWEFKKNTQPFTRNNAGCTFKNPPGDKAGALIDRAGLKGLTCGGASVCIQHANFLIACPGTPAADILELIALIRRRVAEMFGIQLELEIEVW
jgi:UDP-N-acetylmuramate dehydrogenase